MVGHGIASRHAPLKSMETWRLLGGNQVPRRRTRRWGLYEKNNFTICLRPRPPSDQPSFQQDEDGEGDLDDRLLLAQALLRGKRSADVDRGASDEPPWAPAASLACVDPRDPRACGVDESGGLSNPPPLAMPGATRGDAPAARAMARMLDRPALLGRNSLRR